jgi:protein SCO1/2
MVSTTLAAGMVIKVARADHEHPASAAHEGHEMPAADMSAMGHDEHAAHRMAMAAPQVTIEQHEYDPPNVTLVDQHGQDVRLRELLADGKPVAVNFIFTTCTTICPVLTATWVQFQHELADAAELPEMISISIDPTYDTPEVLEEYAERFGASWTFLTGGTDQIARTLAEFDASRGSKVNHFALTLMRPAHASAWTRVEGLSSAKALADVWRNLTN